MKNMLLVVLALSLLFIAPAAQAGFVVKNALVFSGAGAVHSKVSNTKTAIREKSNSLRAKISERLSFLHPYHMYKTNEWYGIAAISCGVLGLLIPGINLVAILFGLLGMGRGCKAQGLAVTGFVMGVLELVLFLILQTVFISLILL